MAKIIFIIYFLLLTVNLCPGEEGSFLEDAQNNSDNENIDDYDEPKKKVYNGPRFKCWSCQGDQCKTPTICTDAIVCWKASVREINGLERFERACTNDPDHANLLCGKSSSKTDSTYLIDCCRNDLCNNGSFPLLREIDVQNNEEYAFKLTMSILGPIIGIFIFIIGTILLFIFARRIKRKRPLVTKRNKLLSDADIDSLMIHNSSSTPGLIGNGNNPHELRATAAGESTLREFNDGKSLTSGSGSGLPVLVQRTLSKHVSLIECLGSGGGNGGGFNSEVWKGSWNGESVAVKIYLSHDYSYWQSETEVYSQLLTSRHDNILGYIGSDVTPKPGCVQMWIVTQYHPLGSLYNHLNRSPHPLTLHQTINICLGIINGLLYLHTEINGTKGKKAMAHRNLKSKNILVKNNGSCVIAELASTITQEKLDNNSDDHSDIPPGTKRYISPEILDEKINSKCLESYRRADIYSLGLIIWEVCRRCISNGVALDYMAPYADYFPNLSHEPSIDEMRKLVYLDQRRPEIHNRWSSDPALSGLGKLMCECWHDKPAARLTILRVKKTLINLVKLSGNDTRVHLQLD
ncbi:activin receptor type-1-like [Aphidius gifuensis]|uniref:activin receptor type-1-like n=1 Tax=Aphidius gifuensis TaxID=684658 RepID=UPI001CDB755A|nr:activin receptor type-1-like [Aphidius gifuensis]